MISSICFCGIHASIPLYTMHMDLILPPNESQYNTRSLSPTRDQVTLRSVASLATMYTRACARTQHVPAHPPPFPGSISHDLQVFWLCSAGSACSAAKFQFQESLHNPWEVSQPFQFAFPSYPGILCITFFFTKLHLIPVCSSVPLYPRAPSDTSVSDEPWASWALSLFFVQSISTERRKEEIWPLTSKHRHTDIPLLFSIRQNPLQTI